MSIKKHRIEEIVIFLLFITIFFIIFLIYTSCGVFFAYIFGITTFSLVWFATIIIWPLPLLFIIWFCLLVYGLTMTAFLKNSLREFTRRLEKEGN
jgi:hypothetical protein